MARTYYKRDQTSTIFPIVRIDGLTISILGGNVNRANEVVAISSAKISLVPEADNYIEVDWASREIKSRLDGWSARSIPLYMFTTDSEEIIAQVDSRGILRQSAHTEMATASQWIYDTVVAEDTGWTDLDLSKKVNIPSGATGVILEINVKEGGDVSAGDAPYVLLRRPGDSSQSQWKSVVPQVTGRWFPRTITLGLGTDGKTIQYNINVSTSIAVKVALAGWVFG